MTAINTIGRANVVPATNKSGGALALGDVVIVDTGNNDAVTTTTSAAATVNVGVCLETIANNAQGKVLFNGYAPLINTSGSVTRGHYGATHTVAKQAADVGAARTSGTFVQFWTGGTTPDGYVFNPDLGTGGSTIITKEEGSTLSSSVTTLDFVGAGITASGAGATTTVTVPGGATVSYLGYNTIGGTSGAATAHLIYLKKITVAAAGVITSIDAYIKQNTAATTVIMAAGLWEDSAGSPFKQMGGGAVTIFGQITGGTPGSARWVSVPYGGAVTATDYWIGFQLSNTSYDVYSDGSGTDKTVAPNSTPQLADYGGNIYTLATTTNKYSLRATYLK